MQASPNEGMHYTGAHTYAHANTCLNAHKRQKHTHLRRAASVAAERVGFLVSPMEPRALADKRLARARVSLGRAPAIYGKQIKGDIRSVIDVHQFAYRP